MVFPLAIPIAANAVGSGIALSGVGQGLKFTARAKRYGRVFSQKFGESFPFGVGYASGTFTGFPKNYERKRSYGNNKYYSNNQSNMRGQTFSYRYHYPFVVRRRRNGRTVYYKKRQRYY